MSNNSVIEHRANYHFVALREEYLLICQQCRYRKPDTAKSKNKASIHCKALILDILEQWTNTKRDQRASLAIYMTYKQWADAMYGMFGRNVIIDSLDELIGEGLIAKGPYKLHGKDTFQYVLNYQEVNRRMKALPEKALDKLLPQKEALTNKRENDNTRLQVNANRFTSKPDTRLQINEDAFTSNHNIESTEDLYTDTHIERMNTRSSLFDNDEQRRIDGYFLKCSTRIPQVTDDLKRYWDILAPRVHSQEDMNSLYELTKQKCANRTDPRVWPGNLVEFVESWEAELYIPPVPTMDVPEMPEECPVVVPSRKVTMFVKNPMKYAFRELTGGDEDIECLERVQQMCDETGFRDMFALRSFVEQAVRTTQIYAWNWSREEMLTYFEKTLKKSLTQQQASA